MSISPDITLSSDELCSVDIAPQDPGGSEIIQELNC